MSYPVTKAAKRVTHELHGVVVSAGLMQKTVKVRVGGQKYAPKLQKVETTPLTYPTPLIWATFSLNIFTDVYDTENAPSA